MSRVSSISARYWSTVSTRSIPTERINRRISWRANSRTTSPLSSLALSTPSAVAVW